MESQSKANPTFYVCFSFLFRLGCQLKASLAKGFSGEQTGTLVYASKSPGQSVLSKDFNLKVKPADPH